MFMVVPRAAGWEGDGPEGPSGSMERVCYLEHLILGQLAADAIDDAFGLPQDQAGDARVVADCQAGMAVDGHRLRVGAIDWHRDREGGRRPADGLDLRCQSG